MSTISVEVTLGSMGYCILSICETDVVDANFKEELKGSTGFRVHFRLVGMRPCVFRSIYTRTLILQSQFYDMSHEADFPGKISTPLLG